MPMRNWTFLAFYLAGTGCALVYSLLMLVSPIRAIRLTDRLARSERYVERRLDWKPGLLLGWRIAGLLGAFISAVMMEPAIETLSRSAGVRPLVRSMGAKPEASWYPVFAGLAVLVGGLYIALNPARFVQWIRGTRPELVFSQQAVSRSLPFARILGVLIAVAGLFVVAVSLWRFQ
jgi:hypothetical protein